jgi:PAS domain S-box-containing protein
MFYALAAGTLLAGTIPTHRMQWLGTASLHGLLETMAGVLAVVAGASVLVRYCSRRTNSDLLLGAALLGAALLNGFHAAIATFSCAACGRAPLQYLIGWSGILSRFLLAGMMCASAAGHLAERRHGALRPLRPAAAFLVTALLCVGGILAICFIQWPSYDYPDALISRPADLCAGILYALALFAFLVAGDWRTGVFEHWRILFLISLSVGEIGYMSFSRAPFDPASILAHLFEDLGYALVTVGLLAARHASFRSQATIESSFRRLAALTAQQNAAHHRDQDELRVWNEELERRVQERTAELAERNRLVAMRIEVGSILGRTGDLRVSLQQVAERIVRHLEAGLVRIWTLEPGGTVLHLQASAGTTDSLEDRNATFEIGTGPIGEVAATGLPRLVAADSEGIPKGLEAAQGSSLHCFFGLPLIVDSRTLGVLAIYGQSALPEPVRNELQGLTQELALGIARKLAERSLRLSHERFRLAAANASDLVWQWNPANDEIEYFAAGQAVPGTGELPAKLGKLRNLLPPDRDRLRARLRENVRTGAPISEEYRVLVPGGEIRHWAMRATQLRGVDGYPDVWICASTDITDRKRHEGAIARLESILESCDAAVMSSNLAGVFDYWNRAAERIFGYTSADIVGKRISTLLPPGMPAGEQEAILQRIQGGETVRNHETVRLAKDGSRVEVMMNVSGLRNSSGAIIGMASVMTDVTARKQLERQLVHSQKLESVGQLAAGVAHEINTPIQFIGDNIRFLGGSFGELDQLLASYAGLRDAARSGPVDPTLIESVERAESTADIDYLREEIPKSIRQSIDGVDRIAAIVKAIREFSHPGQAEKVAVDLNHAIETTALVSRNEWKYVAELTLQLDPQLPQVHCVPGEINQVLLNLIVNAAHAIAEAAPASSGNSGRIVISTHSEGTCVEVRVADTGTGIPEFARPNVFNPFFTTKQVGKGTGQGLAIAHSVVVKRHHGDIRFETEMGKGTTFFVRLPVDGSGESAARPAA